MRTCPVSTVDGLYLISPPALRRLMDAPNCRNWARPALIPSAKRGDRKIRLPQQGTQRRTFGIVTSERRDDLRKGGNVPSAVDGRSGKRIILGQLMIIEVEENLVRQLVAFVLTLDPVIELATDYVLPPPPSPPPTLPHPPR